MFGDTVKKNQHFQVKQDLVLRSSLVTRGEKLVVSSIFILTSHTQPPGSAFCYPFILSLIYAPRFILLVHIATVVGEAFLMKKSLPEN